MRAVRKTRKNFSRVYIIGRSLIATIYKDESCYILVELYNEAGDKFDDEKIRILEQAIR